MNRLFAFASAAWYALFASQGLFLALGLVLAPPPPRAEPTCAKPQHSCCCSATAHDSGSCKCGSKHEKADVAYFITAQCSTGSPEDIASPAALTAFHHDAAPVLETPAATGILIVAGFSLPPGATPDGLDKVPLL